MTKLSITKEQIVKFYKVSKRFGEIRKKAKNTSICIIEKEERKILLNRIDDLEKDPSAAVSWREVHHTR